MWDTETYAAIFLVVGGTMALLPFIDRDTTAGRLGPCIACVMLMVRTLVWRLTDTLPPFDLTFQGIWPYVFVLFECLNSCGCILLFVFLSRTVDRRAESARNYSWLMKTPPRVAIFIATYNEEDAILERTIIGAQSQDYANFEVFVLDDGRRDWLADLCTKRNARYLRRNEKLHAKAGNINHALEVLNQEGDAAEFVAVLDADFVAHPNFLKHALPLFHDPSVGIVQTPQHFFNPDPLQHGFQSAHRWPDEQRFFFDVILASKDAWGIAFCCGTSSVSRRAALNAVGGVPVESITEDMLLSLKLKAAGWKTIYLNMRLSMGLAPEGVGEYVTQRRRWCLGFIQIARSKWGPFGSARLPFMDRLSLIDTFLYWVISFPFRILCLVSPIVFGLTGKAAFDATADSVVSHYGLSIAETMIVLIWITRGRVLPILSDAGQLLVTLDAMKAAFKGLLNPHGHGFQVTAKGGDRSRVVVQWPLLLTFFLPLLVMSLAATFYGMTSDASPIYGSASLPIWLFWCYYNIVVIAVTCFTCIELPRPMANNLMAHEEAWLSVGANPIRYRVLLLSDQGALLSGRTKAALGTELDFQFANLDQPVRARLAKKQRKTFEVEFIAGNAQRESLIRMLFSGRYQAGPEEFRLSDVGTAIAGRFIR